ncbi:hypothetical protein Kfla_0516 [Kribbella flavida DSM 17836]|uniref:Uncharacterized protein n=1 Tax=Kribbella flavida (strain DSM 17836 / JCM 10339 / NBRC 14399) TaxID=479435 RepID=D2PVY1_KRIFD|nr:hypothetical protein [Kribbella flavida]ADB29638.1 hypothetical protein Kfla_0516 [Kribbella flavida DSM 17836]
MSRGGRATTVAALASLPALPLGWFVALQAHPAWIPAAYLGYLLVVIAVPGTMLWRRLTGGTGWFVVDAALGTTFGLACEALVYPLGRWLDVPMVALVLPALALGLALAVPAKTRPSRPTPWWAVAGVMVSTGLVAAWFVRVGSRVIPLDGPAALRPNTDSPFQLSLAAELTHHFPPQVPYVAGEPLTYHWMAYNHIASAHWITGIELDVLTQRVVPLAFLLLTTLAAAAVGMVLTGRAVAAPIAAGLTVLAGDLAPWGWAVTHTLYHDSPLSMGQMISPTQAFSTVLMLPLIAVTALLLRREQDQAKQRLAGLFLVAAVLITVLSISKATALPVYGAGLAAAWIYLTVKARRLNLRALVLGLTVGATYAVNFFFVLRGASHGMELKPAGTYRSMLDGMLRGIDPSVQPGPSVLAVVAAAVLIGWLMPATGALLIRRRLPRDPMVVLLLAGLIGAIAAVSVLYHYSQAQVFFARTAFVYGVLLATWGLSSLDRRQYFVVAPALALGVAAINLGRSRTDTLIRDCRDTSCLQRIFAEPPVVALAVTAAGIVVLGLLSRGSRRTWAVIAVAALIGLTVSPTVVSLRRFALPPQTAYDSIAPGGIEAARFIRRQSGPDDLIATNIHCHAPTGPRCHTGSFWIPGYAERRVLVQGWSYTAKANDAQTSTEASYGQFWDQEKLRVNDAAFSAPTRESLDRLRAQYGVRWLLADGRVNPVSDQLERLAELRFQSGTVRVYQLYPPRGDQAANPVP